MQPQPLPIPPSPLQAILEGLPVLRNGWPGGRWTWDTRFDCAACVCSAEDAGPVLAQLLRTLPERYDCVRIGDAPPAVQATVARMGGIRSGQHLYVGIAGGSGVPWAVWWPWQDGRAFSVRAGFAR